MQTCSGARSGGPLVAQTLGQLEAVDAVHPVEMFGDIAGLVALQRSDEMPLQRGPVGAQRGDLVHRFLHIVLAEGGLPECGGAGDVFCGKGFGHRQQGDRVRIAPGCCGGLCDALAHRGQRVGERRDKRGGEGHGPTKSGSIQQFHPGQPAELRETVVLTLR
jgi:hypothetical protein